MHIILNKFPLNFYAFNPKFQRLSFLTMKNKSNLLEFLNSNKKLNLLIHSYANYRAYM